MDRFTKYISYFLLSSLGITGFIAFFAVLYALPTMLLWNWLMPEIFALPEIDFFQAFGLTFLSGIFFKNKNYDNSTYNTSTQEQKTASQL